MESKRLKKFTYGDQFEPTKFSLVEILELCKECQPSRNRLEANIGQRYFSKHSQRASSTLSAKNIGILAMNCFLSLRAYQLIEDLEQPRQYQLTSLAQEILANADNTSFVNQRFAAHILNNLSGMALLKAIDAVNARGEEAQLEPIAYELQERGYIISPSGTYTSTMRSWLSQAGVFEREYEINWDIVSEILGINKDFIDELYTLTPGQKHFLLSLLNLDVKELIAANKVAQHTRSIYKLRLTTKNLVKDVIEPLASLSLIETEKTTGGRGAKSNKVKLTSKAQSELLAPLLKSIANETRLSEIELNRTFDDVVNELNHPDKHIKGKALELLAVWMIRLTSLRFTKWRSRENGKGEVDVLAASDRFVYSRWQIQCKNTKKVDIDVLAKEIGLTFVTGADVVMVVTTGEFTRDAYQYAYRMMEVSRYYMILLQKDDIEAIKRDKTNIVEIFDRKARRVFAKKELDVSDEELNEIEQEEDLMAEAIEEEIDDNI
ncbi:MAG: restriction endonuclease [Nostoc sp.]|uniref:restriction endonuclease n=2 Tax=Nostoc sp. TaxID=1180 RepID=UPI002FF58098